MTIEELIKKLSEGSPGAQIYIRKDDGGVIENIGVSFDDLCDVELYETTDPEQLSKCCNARMVNGGIQCEACGSNGK